MFSVNDLFQVKGLDGKTQTERILWIDEGIVICYTIDIETRNAKPTLVKLSDLNELKEHGLLQFIEDDPYAYIYQEDEDIAEKYKEIRDKRWIDIEPLIVQEPEIFQRKVRGRLLREAEIATGLTKKSYYKYLTLYWQRGMTKNALLPDYHRSGGKGKEKTFTDKRNGRPSLFPEIDGKGVVLTDEIKEKFERGVNRFYHTTDKNTLTFAFHQTLRTYFNEGFKFEDGVRQPILPDQKELPTYRQFQWWYGKRYQAEEQMQKRKGKRKSDMEDRALLGTSVGDMDGPGTRFQLDATIADVYLLSSYMDDKIIGRPVLYFITDTFSRMVVGMYIGLEGPSWLGAMMAIANTASDKVEYCKKYGIEITETQWPSHHLPHTLTTDNGEGKGKNIEHLINAFGIRVENTPSYRADFKGIVERKFGVIQGSVRPFLPGWVDTEVRVRGDKDYRPQAQETLESFTRIIINTVLHYNTHHWHKDYLRSTQMAKDGVDPVPVALWEWGIKNLTGRLRTFPENIIRLHLLPKEKARVTRYGIKFKKMFYRTERAIREGWFTDAAQRTWSIDIKVDPRDVSHVFIPHEDGMSYDIATLVEHQERYSERTIQDVEYLLKYELRNHKNHLPKERQHKSDTDSKNEAIVNDSKKKAQATRTNSSDAARIKGIRPNRAEDKKENRKAEAFLEEMVGTPLTKPTEPLACNTEVESARLPSQIEKLRQKQKEMKARAIQRRQ